MLSKRAVLEVLSRDDLLRLVDPCELEVLAAALSALVAAYPLLCFKGGS